MIRRYKVVICVLSFFFVVAWQSSLQATKVPSHQTIAGTGPDKWASVWLIRSYLNSAPVAIAASETELSLELTTFDTDNSALTRTGSTTTYTAFLTAHSIDDSVAVKLGKIIHDIEINAWNPNREVESLLVENAFRQMQLKYGRDNVSQNCYMTFFERVTKVLKQGDIPLDADVSDFIPSKECLNKTNLTTVATSEKHNTLKVPELELTQVLNSVSAGSKVVFVDTREAFEFREGHIPGAVNFTLRQLDATVIGSLVDADLVIAYCVKDFRGFEAARTLRKHGVNAAIMNPYGIKGWRKAGLPIVGSRGLNELEAATAMKKILIDTQDTLTGTI